VIVDVKAKEVKPKPSRTLSPMDFGIVANMDNPIDELSWIRVRPDLKSSVRRRWLFRFYKDPDGRGLTDGFCFCSEDNTVTMFSPDGGLREYSRLHKRATGIDFRRYLECLDFNLICLRCGYRFLATKDFVRTSTFEVAVANQCLAWIRQINLFVTLGPSAQKELVENAYKLSTPAPAKESRRIQSDSSGDSRSADKRLVKGDQGRHMQMELNALSSAFARTFLKPTRSQGLDQEKSPQS